MASLSNYLRINRKRLTLSQSEVAFLLGVNGMGKDKKVSRDENNARVPSLEVALAYEAIYGRPVRELFAGMYEQAEQQVAQRAKVLSYAKTGKSRSKRQQVIADLFSQLGVQTTPHEPTA